MTVILVGTLAGCVYGGPDDGYSPPPSFTYGKRPAHVPDPKLRKVYELIYPYYQRPRYRYPFYDHEGNGELLYGYGGPRLYKYTIFKPVEGYLRRSQGLGGGTEKRVNNKLVSSIHPGPSL
ncbi:hypothetical protein Hamer_G008704 [Homarus americanus]|uniref:Uncharacterized protein n=1 Tax=Homarus americanus TaxID=6706 RepID=A0A8J5N4U5_HOMAM|nr:hypothetical protein Hamer_G008704 [Homarus americanus]